MFKQVKLNDAILKFYQRSQPIAFSNAETLYDDLVLLRDQILMYGDLSEAQTNYLNNFIEKFDTTLSTTVRDIFEKWLDDGFLVDLIRDIINEEVVEARDGESKLNLRLNRDKQELTTQLTDIHENVKFHGAKGDGISDDTAIIQYCLDNYQNVFLPEGVFLVQKLKLNAFNRLTGVGLQKSILKSMNTSDPIFIEADRSAIESSISDIRIITTINLQNTQKGLVLSNNGVQVAQDTHINLENVVISGFLMNLEVQSHHRGLLAQNVRCDGAVRNNFHLLGTDNKYIACNSAMCQEDGFYIAGPNNRFIGCKSFVSGRGMVYGSGFRVNTSFNIFIGCESQENRLCNLYLYNAQCCIIDGFTLDGAGAHNPSLTYNDTEFSNVVVPTSSLRLHNCKNSQISVSIVNGRVIGGNEWKCKTGIFSLYPGLDVGNNINVNLRDSTTDGSFSEITPDNLYYSVMNSIAINSLKATDRNSIKHTLFTRTSYDTVGDVIVSDDSLTLNVDDSTTGSTRYEYTLKNNVDIFVFGKMEISDYNINRVELVSEIQISYVDTNDVIKYVTSPWAYPGKDPVQVDVSAFKSTFSDIKTIRFVKFRIRAFAKSVGTGEIYPVVIKKPIFYEALN